MSEGEKEREGVCVWERERERERGLDSIKIWLERERERENKRLMERKNKRLIQRKRVRERDIGVSEWERKRWKRDWEWERSNFIVYFHNNDNSRFGQLALAKWPKVAWTMSINEQLDNHKKCHPCLCQQWPTARKRQARRKLAVPDETRHGWFTVHLT